MQESLQMNIHTTEETLTCLFLEGNNIEIQDYFFEKIAGINTILALCENDIKEIKKWGRMKALFKKAHIKQADISQKTIEAVELLSQRTAGMFDVMIRLSLSNIALAQTIAEGLIKHAQIIQDDKTFSNNFKKHFSASVLHFKTCIDEQECAYKERQKRERILEERIAALEQNSSDLLKKYKKLESDTLARLGETPKGANSFSGKFKLGVKKFWLNIAAIPFLKYFIPATVVLILVYIVLLTMFPPLFENLFKSR